MKKFVILIVLVTLTALSLIFYSIRDKKSGSAESGSQEQSYNPQINPADFSTAITNAFFTLPVGKKFVYEEQTAEGLERNEINIKADIRSIMGVETLTYHDLVYLEGELVEETRDYLAQDKEGNVWYFGEVVDNYDDGELVDHNGSWIAGEGGAMPGIWIKSKHTVGDSYRQEYLKGEAEDMTDVVATDQTVEVSFGSFTGCVKMYDWTPLDPESKEYKYYCPEVGGLVLVENVVTRERSELINFN